MGLANCVNHFDALNPQDKAFLLDALGDGATAEQALNSLEQAIRQELQGIADRVESGGGIVQREAPEYFAQRSKRLGPDTPPEIQQLIIEANREWGATLRKANWRNKDFEIRLKNVSPVLRSMGIDDEVLSMTVRRVEEVGRRHGDDVPDKVLAGLPGYLVDPLFVLPHKHGYSVIIDEKSNSGEYINVAVTESTISTITPWENGEERVAYKVKKAKENNLRVYDRNREASDEPEASESSRDVGLIPTGRKKDTKNVLSFSDVFKDSALEQKERGRYFIANRMIQLTKDSDLSSFLHESGHYFLEMEKFFADKYGLDDNQKAILEWLDVDSFDDITTEHHERWAETFEVYLREGKAPSLGLRRAFASFARWLKKIYRVLLGDPRLSRADLDPEITGIFDRLLATEAEIATAAAKPEYDQFFRSQEQAGMTDAEWKKHQAQAQKVKDEAQRTLDERAIEQYMRMKTREWNEEKAPLVEEEKEQLRKQPVYQILSDITVKTDKESGEKIGAPMDTEKLRELFPDGKIPGRFTGKHRKESGVDPALYAEAYGYPSAGAMVKDIMAQPPLNEAADQAAQDRMVEKYGDIINDGTLEEEVREALINDEQAKLLLMELKAMRSDRRTQGINREYLKAEAEQMIAGMKYREIKPDRYYRAMVKAAERAAAAREKAEDATEYKLQQLANHYLYKEALRVKEQMDKHRKFIRQRQRQKFDTKQVDPSYAQQIKMLAEMYEMRDRPQQMATLASILDFYQAQINELDSELTELSLLDPNLVRALEYRLEHGNNLAGFDLIAFDDMTVEDIHGVVDMLRHLRYVGGQIAEMNGEEAVRQRTELVGSILKNGGKDSKIQRGKQRAAESARRAWNHMVNTMPSLANMVRKLDGNKGGGLAFDLIYQVISDAHDRKLELNKDFYDTFEQLMGDISKVNLSRRDARAYTAENGAKMEFSSEEVFMMALYWGTESSRDAIMQGHDLTENDVYALMSTLAEDQLKLVNTVWAMNELHWPQLRDAAVDMVGFAPPKLSPASFEINGVQMTGGHMQLFYDSQRVDLANEQEAGRRTSAIVPTKAGSLNARVGSGGMPVLLDITNITRSVDDKIHYIAYAKAGRKLRQLLNNSEIKAAIERKHGPGFYQAFIESIEGITGGRLAQETHGGIAKASRWMRSNATLMHLGYSIRNTVQQLSAVPIAIGEVGPVKFLQASAQLLAHSGDQINFVNSKSKFMENRARLVNRETREFMKQLIAKSEIGHTWEKFKAHAFILQTMTDSVIAYPTWLAAYNNAMEEHGDEKRSRIEADTVVAQSVGSGSDLHLGRIMQSNQGEMIKTVTMFGSWFNAYYQRLYRSSKGGEDFLNIAFVMDALILPFIVANITQALIMDTPDDDETMAEYLFKNTFFFLTGTIPVINQTATYVKGFTPSAPIYGLTGSPVRIAQEAESMLSGRQSGLKTASDIGKAVTSVVPVPGSGQAWRIIDYADAYMRGEERHFNPYQMLTEGPDKDR